MMRVVDYIIDFLYKKGVRYIFTLAGGGAMFLNDAVICHKKIKYICHHHEQAAAMAAEAYAKTKNSASAVMVTSGCGSTNAITGLLEAYQNSIPVIFLSSQAKKSQMIHFSRIPSLRQFGIQEVDITAIVKPLTKYASIVKDPQETKWQIEKAYFLAVSGRPGPVWLDIPLDVAASYIKLDNLFGYDKKETNNSPPLLSKRKIVKIVNLLISSKKPVIIAGGGVKLAGAIGQFRQLVKALKIPVVVPDMGLDLLEYNNPYYIGHGGTKGDRAANIVMQNSDLIISIGSRLAVPFIGHEYDKFSPKSYKIVVDIDPEEHQKKTINIDSFIFSDAKYFINKLTEAVIESQYKSNYDWLKRCQKIKKKYALFLPPVKSKNNSVNMYQAINAISKHSLPGDIFISDAGITVYVCTQTLKFKKNQRMIIPGATLTMGYNLPAVIGVWAAQKNSRIICITGDGSFQLNIHELATIVYHKIPAKIFVINNQGYLAIRTTQKNFFAGRLIGEGPKSGVFFPETKKIAKAYGIKFYRICCERELSTKIPQVLNYKGTVICEIVCPQWQDTLSVSSKKMTDGKMVSLPIDDMFPFLSDKEMERIRKELKDTLS